MVVQQDRRLIHGRKTERRISSLQRIRANEIGTNGSLKLGEKNCFQSEKLFISTSVPADLARSPQIYAPAKRKDSKVEGCCNRPQSLPLRERVRPVFAWSARGQRSV